MKFSSPANIALASIALSSPNLLSSPVFVNAAPTGDPGTLSPNLGAGYFGGKSSRPECRVISHHFQFALASPQMHATDSPVMPTMPSPSTSKIAGRRRSLRRSRSIKHRRGESSSRNIDPLGLGVNAGDIQPKAESIFRPRAAPAGPLSGTLGTVDPFSPIVSPGGLFANTGLVPPNTPVLGGVPLSNGVDPSTLIGAIPAVVPTPGVDNIIQNIQNTATGAPGSLLSPLTTDSLPLVNGLSPSLGAVPVSLPQVPGASIPVLGNLPQLPGAIPPLAGGLSSVQGIATQVTGTVPQPSKVNGLAPPVALPNLGASPNAAMPPMTGALPQVPGLLADPRVSDSFPQLPDTVPQVPDALSQAAGGTAMVPKVPDIVSPTGPLSKVNPDLVTPSLAGYIPVPVGSGIPLASPVAPAPGLVAPMDTLPAFATSVVSVSSFALPTPVSGSDALSALLPNSDTPPASVMDGLTQPIQSLAPDPVRSSNPIPNIIVSGPDAVGTFEPLEGVGAGVTEQPNGAQTESKHSESGIPSMESGEFDGSAVEPGTTSKSEQPTTDPTTTELAPTTLAKTIAKLDVPTTTESSASKPTPIDAQLATSPESTPNVNEVILPVRKRWESKPLNLPSDIGSSVTDKSGSPLLSEGIPPGESQCIKVG
ncbi:unnamed protein product [Rhizoctonia solani]|uniref:Uncharacterized protein n=1 Tax=Rhizoctonia solani TaxID=456999 RepID=A0A8H2WZ33_9AGAM|nr:unnamed protein product [Rhizoctonia solani]